MVHGTPDSAAPTRVAWLLLLVAGTVAAILLTAGGEGASPVEGDAERGTSRESPPPPLLVGHGDAGEPVESPGVGPSDGDASAKRVVTHLLRGRVLGLDRTLPGRATVLVKGLTDAYEPPAMEPTGTVDGEGRFEIDLTALFVATPGLIELQVQVEHPCHLAAPTRIPLGAETKKDASPRVYETVLRVKPAGLVVGRVIQPDGSPVEDAVVGLLEMADDVPRNPALEWMRTGADGTFRLRVGETKPYAVVATARDFRPCSRVFTSGPGRTVDLKDLRLDPGASISGRVTLFGQPIAGAAIEAGRRTPGGTWLYLGSTTVTWTKGEAYPGHPKTACDADGRYVLSGLVPGTYYVRPRGPTSLRAHMTVWERQTRDVRAPAEGVDFALDPARLVLHVRAEGKPLAGASLYTTGVGWGMGGLYGGKADEEGRYDVLVVPGAGYTVSIRTDGYERTEEEHVAPGPGETTEVVIEVEPAWPRPTLEVTLVGPHGESIPEAGFGFFKPGRDWRWAEKNTTVRSGDNVFRFKAWPGRWRMVVRAGGPWRWGGGLYAEAETVVDLAPGETVAAHVDVPAGGRLSIAARSPDGRILGARCTIRDDAGRALPVLFGRRSQRGAVGGTGHLGRGTASQVDPALPPGTYHVELAKDGYRSRTVEVEVEACRWTEVDVTMEPSR